MNKLDAQETVNWLFLDLNAFFASCEQEENPGLRGRPIIIVQMITDYTCAVAASYEAKAFGIKTGTSVREAKQLCPTLVPVQANHRLYTLYHERILQVIDSYLPIEKVLSIDEFACRLMGHERRIEVAREIALKIKLALRERIGECLTASIGLAPSIFLSKVASDIEKPDGLVVITKNNLPEVLLHLKLQDIYGIGPRMERRLKRAGVCSVADLGRHSGRPLSPAPARRRFAASGLALCAQPWTSACPRARTKDEGDSAAIRSTSPDKSSRAAESQRSFLPAPWSSSAVDG